MENLKPIIGKNVRELISKSDLKHKTDLAKKVGSNHRTIYDIVANEGNPKLDTISSVANALNTPAWTLLVDGFPFANKASTVKILEISSKLKEEDLQDLLAIAKTKYETHKIRQELAKYDAKNPLLK